jgi:hypothetical protein
MKSECEEEEKKKESEKKEENESFYEGLAGRTRIKFFATLSH